MPLSFAGCSYTLDYVVQANQITIQVTTNATTWIGLGFHQNSTDEATMASTDIFVALFADNGSVTVDE